MSILRDIRLVAAEHLSLPSECRHAFIKLLAAIDSELDKEGYDPGKEVKKALEKFENSLLELDDVREVTNEEELFADGVEFIDIADMDFIDPSTEE